MIIKVKNAPQRDVSEKHIGQHLSGPFRDGLNSEKPGSEVSQMFKDRSRANRHTDTHTHTHTHTTELAHSDKQGTFKALPFLKHTRSHTHARSHTEQQWFEREQPVCSELMAFTGGMALTGSMSYPLGLACFLSVKSA